MGSFNHISSSLPLQPCEMLYGTIWCRAPPRVLAGHEVVSPWLTVTAGKRHQSLGWNLGFSRKNHINWSLAFFTPVNFAVDVYTPLKYGGCLVWECFFKFGMFPWLYILTQQVFYDCIKASVFTFRMLYMLIWVQLHHQMQSRDT